MLYGLALENLLKGLAIKRDPSLFDRIGRFSHGLISPFDNLGIPLSARQRLLLKHLEVVLLWRDRYPVPKRSSSWSLTSGPDGDSCIPGSLSIHHRAEVFELLNLVESELPAIAPI
jgi:hypothetical protein